MSDSVKPEEEPLVLESSNVTEGITATSEAAPAARVDEVTPAIADAPAEESTAVDEKKEKPEPKEITQGTLTKATHGGLLAFFNKKRFFYFQDEPISEEKLKVYIHKETSARSAATAAATAAYASQTGKGLLLYSKTEGQREVPHGIIKLADVTEVVPAGAAKFILKLATQELHFETPPAERDSWVFTLNHKINEAKATSEEIINSEGYKATLEKLTAAKAPEKTSEAEAEEANDTENMPKRDDVDSTPSGAEEEAGPADKKVTRSTSKKNKKNSVFTFLDKKKKPEEKTEEEQKGEAKSTDPEAAVPALVPEDAPTEIRETIEADDAEKYVEPAVAPKPTKKNNIFSAFTRGGKEKEVEEVKKETETAEPTEAVPTEGKPIDAPVEAAERTVASSPPKPKFFPNFFDKKEKIPVAKAAEKETETKHPGATETPTETAEITPVPAVDDSTSPDIVSPATSPKEQKRKSIFFFMKDKKPEDVKSDSEDTEPTHKSGSTSPLPKAGTAIMGLMRKASKSTRHAAKEAENKGVVAPETVAEEHAPTSTETGETTTVPAESTEPATTSVGDVVAEAVNVSQPPVQAAA